MVFLPCDARMAFFNDNKNELFQIIYTLKSRRCLFIAYYRNLNIEILLKRLNLKLRLACCKVSFELTIVTEVNDEA